MKLTIYSKFLNIHQVAVSDELYSLLGENFHFVATTSPRIEELKGASDCSSRSYCVKPYERQSEYEKAMHLAVNSDVCVFGGCSIEYAICRANKNPKGLSFEMAERWLKKGWINILSPHFCRWWLNYMHYYRKANFYKLCASSFASKDDKLLGVYKHRHFKWGYFTKVDRDYEVEAALQGASTSEITPLMWCARFLKLKHPELPVQLAHRLKQKGYKFCIDMFGSGEELEHTKALITELGVEDCVNLRGNLPNKEILKEMRSHSIFLFTSDRNEGWGAVLNEAMSNGAVVVASDEIGSVPFLIKDNVTGMIFKTCNLDSLYEKVSDLMEHPDKLSSISEAAKKQMQDVWSPKQAAVKLLQLIDDIQSGRESSLQEGPCSVC